MRYEDLTPYSYNPKWARPGALNVGWLGDQVPRARKADRVFLQKLAALCCKPVNAMRGFHTCEICGRNPMADGDPFYTEFGRHLGNGEVWVAAPGIRSFVSPTMIYHYVRDHDYAPPKEYVELVMTL